ncbi:cellulose binding domain-containing protein [Spirosoma pollinicola]|uniref:CBM3 domain-containing protein n=1 Tax=Spirosoma pollinicola TaxID=2057025 RepID=A0A2K8Z1C1_9BACT|nr:cellulose binding domain-containing protein [Spirosoma pollinicola]AUD03676.1 hypothetical protein CWM47_18690 [Spirosoma pollinicola]
MNQSLLATIRFWVWFTAILITKMAVANPRPVGSVGAVPTITVSPASLTILNYSEYEGQYPATYTVSATGLTADLVITAPPFFLLSAQGNTGPSLTIPATNGTILSTQISVILLSSSPGTLTGVVTNSSGSAVTTVAVSGTALGQSETVSPTTLNPFTTTVGQPSTVQSYTVTNRGGLSVYVSAPTGFEIRTGTNPFGSSLVINPSLTFASTQIDVRLTGAVVGPVSGVISQDTYYHAAHGVYPVAVSGTVSSGSALPALSVAYRDADYGNRTNQIIRPYLQLRNEGTTPILYSQLTLRYWFTSEGSSPPTNLAVYYSQPGLVQMRYVALDQPRQGAFGYVEYSFKGTGSLPANGNSGPIETGIQKADRSNFNESDDYSYAANYAAYTPNSRITAYLNGMLLWGQEPSLATPQTIVRAYSAARNSPSASQITTRIDLRNEGNTPIPVQDLSIRYWFTSDNGQLAQVHVDYADIGAANVQARVVPLAQAVPGADSYVELKPVSNATLAPMSSLGAIDFRLMRSDNGLLDQRNDYSYAANYGTVGLNSHVGVYLKGVLVYGSSPEGTSGRVAAVDELLPTLQLRVLGNPVVGSQAEMEISGAAGQSVTLRLLDLQGRSLHEQRIEQAGTLERVRVPMGNGQDLLLLKVSTATQQQQVKLIRSR